MSIRLLVIDDHADFRKLLRHHVTSMWPNAQVDEHDPQRNGRLGTVSGNGYDAVLLAHELCDAQEDGLTWLRALRRIPSFPPVIFMGPHDDYRLIVKAMKTGADEYLPKTRLDHETVISTIQETLNGKDQKTRPVDNESTMHSITFDKQPLIKGYHILRTLSKGEISAIYLARSDELELDEQLALKVMSVVESEQLKSTYRRFEQEYDAIAKINHASIVDIYDYGIIPGYAYIAMEYFPCGDLRARLKNPLSAYDCLTYLEQIARALRLVHQANILHRDLKPANVMVREDNSLCLIDFGLAKNLYSRTSLTGAGEIQGTPYYMSPEQALARELDARSDLYSLGVILYEMLTGRKPYKGASPFAVLDQHRNAAIPRLPDSIDVFQPVIDKLMAKNPEHRYQNVDELLAALERL